jgi:hypothetical protein
MQKGPKGKPLGRAQNLYLDTEQVVLVLHELNLSRPGELFEGRWKHALQ